MPITKTEFEEAQRPLTDRIISFLEEHSDNAYTDYEIWGGILGYSDMSLSLMLLAASREEGRVENLLRPYQEALVALERAGKIRSAEIKGQIYYCIESDEF